MIPFEKYGLFGGAAIVFVVTFVWAFRRMFESVMKSHDEYRKYLGENIRVLKDIENTLGKISFNLEQLNSKCTGTNSARHDIVTPPPRVR